jgi:predicted nucleic acid-binding protein
MRVALDTNRLTDPLDSTDGVGRDQGRITWRDNAVTARHRNEALLQRFLAKETVSVLLPGRETAEHYARMFVQLKRAGTPVPDNDLWIAALALEHDLTLITRDRHFERIPQLPRE